MPSLIYQDMVNLIVGVPIWSCPSIFMNVAMWEHCTFDNEIFRCGKISDILEGENVKFLFQVLPVTNLKLQGTVFHMCICGNRANIWTVFKLLPGFTQHIGINVIYQLWSQPDL
jgi:hypothetical protein